MTRNDRWFQLALVAALLTFSGIPGVTAAHAQLTSGDADPAPHTATKKLRAGKATDDDWHPLRDRERQLRQDALHERLKKGGTGRVHRTANGQYVELERQAETRLWVLPAEFGTGVHPVFGGAPGPLHNQISEPDRTVDTSTIWRPDFSRDHLRALFFSEAPGAPSLRNYYVEVSSNRYAVTGDVADWVRVSFNSVRYGNTTCGNINVACAFSSQLLIRDSVNAWYAQAISEGQTAADVNAYLSQFDVWDRYDHDGDGNFDEPDGYIDAFQSIHAGRGYEMSLDPRDIWSHAGYVFGHLIGVTGPSFNRLGGVRIGATNYWIGNYSILPENAGIGVTAHEFAHATLGLPDLYDTAGGPNATGFWSLMAAGSTNADGTNGRGFTAPHPGAWEKLQLGWLNYEPARAGQKSSHQLGPSTANTKQAQAIFVELPDKVVVTPVAPPYAGANFYYSGSGDSLDHLMYRSVTLPANAQLSAQVRYQTELDFDYAYLVVSSDAGQTWTPVATNLSSATNPFGQNFGHGITGTSNESWVLLTADLSDFPGSVLIGFRYWTDPLVTEPGFMIDDIAITGQPVDGAEPGSPSWQFAPAAGFGISRATRTTTHFNAYLAEFRHYRGFDESLRTGPWIWPRLDVPLWDLVETYPYQQGLLITYWDSSQTNNNHVSFHPGEGLILPIDAHPEPLTWLGFPWRADVQSSDSPFGLEPTDELLLTNASNAQPTGGRLPVPVFDDRQLYWHPDFPWIGVKNPQTNTVIEVKSVSAQGSFMQVEVRPGDEPKKP